MSIVSQEKYDEWTEEYRREYCSWCFRKDYGNCNFCAIEKNRLPKEQYGITKINKQQPKGCHAGV